MLSLCKKNEDNKLKFGLDGDVLVVLRVVRESQDLVLIVQFSIFGKFENIWRLIGENI